MGKERITRVTKVAKYKLEITIYSHFALLSAFLMF